MKRIALVSPYRGYNYGTVLQAFALQRVIEEKGIEAEYLRYNNTATISLWAKICRKFLTYVRPNRNRAKVSRIDDYSFFYTPAFKNFTNGFESFIGERIKESEIIYTTDTLPFCTIYDAYLVGSDQSWGETRARKTSIFFLDNVNEKYPKFSYAPSIGTTHITQEYLKILKKKLPKFKRLSCREKTNCELLKGELGREVTYVLDPTFLLNKEEWNEIAQKHPCRALKYKGYILCYILGEKQMVSEFAENLGKAKKMPVFYIVTRPLYLKKDNHLFATPENFLALIRDADTVITDSFHGTILSVNYNTQFYSFAKRENEDNVKDKDNDRIQEILETLNLFNRFKGEMSGFEEDINYSEVNKVIDTYRNQSMTYLEKTLVLI